MPILPLFEQQIIIKIINFSFTFYNIFETHTERWLMFGATAKLTDDKHLAFFSQVFTFFLIFQLVQIILMAVLLWVEYLQLQFLFIFYFLFYLTRRRR